MSRYFVGGINGVGKSAIVNHAVAARPSLEKVHTTSMFMEWLGITAGDYEQLRALPDRYKQEQNNAMLTKILASAAAQNRHLILDSHYLNMVEGRIAKLISGGWPQQLGALVLVEADIKVVHDRLGQDTHRQRRLFPPNSSSGEQLDVLHDYSVQTRNEYYAIARDFGLPHYIIQNNGDLAEATGELVAIYDNTCES